MSSKETILRSIRSIGLEKSPLPEVASFKTTYVFREQFTKVLTANHTRVLETRDRDHTRKELAELTKDFQSVCSAIPGMGDIETTSLSDPTEFSQFDLGLVEGAFGVAENGAVWVSDDQYGHRVFPFIVEHLVLVVSAKTLVGNMHEAYQKTELKQKGYGVFISGPSKTGDIEQVLVIGAHGPRSLTVILEGADKS